MKQQLSEKQRLELRRLFKAGSRQCDIAIVLGVHQSTISRELKRNAMDNDYEPLDAQKFTKQRRVDANKSNTKLLRNATLKELITHKLSSGSEDRSPDTISGRLRKEKKESVCTKTIYRYIHTHEPGLKKFLRYKKGYKKHGKTKQESIWQEKRPIETRDPIIELRERLCDVEVDTIVSMGRTCRLFTAFDRVSRFVRMKKTKTGTAKEVCEAMINLLKAENIQSITSDNGTEFADRELVEAYLNIPFFFANPYHSRERATNENGNRCIRKHIPKKLDFSHVSDETFAKIEHMLNHKPRKILNYRTPYEVHRNQETLLFI